MVSIKNILPQKSNQRSNYQFWEKNIEQILNLIAHAEKKMLLNLKHFGKSMFIIDLNRNAIKLVAYMYHFI